MVTRLPLILLAMAACESTSPSAAGGAIGGVKEKGSPGIVQDNKHDDGEYRVQEPGAAYQDGDDIILRKRPGRTKAEARTDPTIVIQGGPAVKKMATSPAKPVESAAGATKAGYQDGDDPLTR